MSTVTKSFVLLLLSFALLPQVSGSCTWKSVTYSTGATITTKCGVVCVCRDFYPYAPDEVASWTSGDKWDCKRVRKEVTQMTTTEINKYVAAVLAVLTDGGASNIVHSFGSLHHSLFNSGIHFAGTFLPWHRQFLWDFETALRKKDCSVTLPYLDSAKSSADLSASTAWSPTRMGGLPGSGCTMSPTYCVPDGPFVYPAYYIPGNVCLRRKKYSCASVKDDIFIAAMMLTSSFTTFSQQLEYDVHNTVHVYIGGTMAQGPSPNEPVFYQHHGFVDKLWLDWQTRSSGVNYWKYATWNPFDTALNSNMPSMTGSTPGLSAATPRSSQRNRWHYIDMFPALSGGTPDDIPVVGPGPSDTWTGVCYRTTFFSCRGYRWWIVDAVLWPVQFQHRTPALTVLGSNFYSNYHSDSYLAQVPRLIANQTTMTVDEFFTFMNMEPTPEIRSSYVQYLHEFPQLYGNTEDYPLGYDHDTLLDYQKEPTYDFHSPQGTTYTPIPHDPRDLYDAYPVVQRSSPPAGHVDSFFDVFTDISVQADGTTGYSGYVEVSMVLRGSDGLPVSGYDARDFSVYYDADPGYPSSFEKTYHPCDCAFVLRYRPRTQHNVTFYMPGGAVRDVLVNTLALPEPICVCPDGRLCNNGACPDMCALMRCSDLNPCTKDSCVNGKCVFESLPDGTPCAFSVTNMGQAVCRGGLCVGVPCCGLQNEPGYNGNPPCPPSYHAQCCSNGRWTCAAPGIETCQPGKPCSCIDYGAYDWITRSSSGALAVGYATLTMDHMSTVCTESSTTMRYVMQNGFCRPVATPCTGMHLLDTLPRCLEQCAKCCPLEAQPGQNGVKHCGSLQRCGGIAGLTCPSGEKCVDDPSDSCDPATGGADCIGMCIAPHYCCDGIWRCPDVVTTADGTTELSPPRCLSTRICPCSDVDGFDFGPCQMILGYAVVAGQCRAVSGCSAPFQLFGTLEDCQSRCPQQCCSAETEPVPGQCPAGHSCCSDGQWRCNAADGSRACRLQGRRCQCKDFQDYDFGICNALLGYAVIGGQCKLVSGCSSPVPLFGTFEDCNRKCFVELTRCCDPRLEPGSTGIPRCFFGHTCCANGEWRCNLANADGTVSSGCSSSAGTIATGVVCTCRDVAGYAVGDCLTFLGFGVLNGVCTSIQGCVAPFPLFSTLSECTTVCPRPPDDGCDKPELHQNIDKCFQAKCIQNSRLCVYSGGRCQCPMNCDHIKLQVNRDTCMQYKCLDSPGQCAWNPAAALGKQCGCSDAVGCDQPQLHMNPDLCHMETCRLPHPNAGSRCAFVQNKCMCPPVLKCEDVPYERCERFDCPHQVEVQWSAWLSLDDPSGPGDIERIADIVQKLQLPCKAPLQIECRVRSTGTPWYLSGQNYMCDVNLGGVCLHVDNPSTKCLDYEVRVSCQPPKRKCQRNDDTHSCRCAEPECSSIPLSDCRNTNCPGQKPMSNWSPWLNRDAPSGTGDWEVWSLLKPLAGLPCDVPTGIECRQRGTQQPIPPSQNVICAPTPGLICQNSNNAAGCLDYEVRFTCDPPPKKCEIFKTTTGVERCDCPKEGCDYQANHLNPQLCTQTLCPTAAADVAAGTKCVYHSVARKCSCPPPPPPDECGIFTNEKDLCLSAKCPSANSGQLTWTPWVDRDDPSVTGDWETIPQMLAMVNLGCPWPHAIECREVGTHLHWSLVGDNNYICNVSSGGICQNKYNPKGCHDYEVRLACRAPDPRCVWNDKTFQCSCPPRDPLCDMVCKRLYVAHTYTGYSVPTTATADGYVRVSPSDISYSSTLADNNIELTFELPHFVGGLQYVAFDGMDPKVHKIPQDLPPHSLQQATATEDTPPAGMIWNNLPPRCYNNTLPSTYTFAPLWTVTQVTACMWRVRASVSLVNGDVKDRMGHSVVTLQDYDDRLVATVRPSVVFMQPASDMANSSAYVAEKHDYATVYEISKVLRATGSSLLLRVYPSFLVVENRPQIQLRVDSGLPEGTVTVTGALVIADAVRWTATLAPSEPGQLQVVYVQLSDPNATMKHLKEKIVVRFLVMCSGYSAPECTQGYFDFTVEPDMMNYVKSSSSSLHVAVSVSTGGAGQYATQQSTVVMTMDIKDFSKLNFASVSIETLSVTCSNTVVILMRQDKLTKEGKQLSTQVTQGYSSYDYRVTVSFIPTNLPPGVCVLQLFGSVVSNARAMRALEERAATNTFEVSRTFTMNERPQMRSSSQSSSIASLSMPMVIGIASGVLIIVTVMVGVAIHIYRKKHKMPRGESTAQLGQKE